jgi:hypothetical protein
LSKDHKARVPGRIRALPSPGKCFSEKIPMTKQILYGQWLKQQRLNRMISLQNKIPGTLSDWRYVISKPPTDAWMQGFITPLWNMFHQVDSGDPSNSSFCSEQSSTDHQDISHIIYPLVN